MLRRVGYILGLLFVVGCAAAYPLTWGRHAMVFYTDRGHITFGWLSSGHLQAGAVQFSDRRPSGFRTHAAQHLVKPWGFYAVGTNTHPIAGANGGAIYFPLWMPALAVSLFMTWRWRRARRRVAAGFPLDERTEQPDE